MTMQNPELECPIHPGERWRGTQKVGGMDVHPCGCSHYDACLYRDCARAGECDPRYLSPEDWYELEAHRMRERAPA